MYCIGQTTIIIAIMYDDDVIIDHLPSRCKPPIAYAAAVETTASRLSSRSES